tara:strand:- start:117 stop:413 length:297 start_codon:yes stop_codon:yes gene_type:complete
MISCGEHRLGGAAMQGAQRVHVPLTRLPIVVFAIADIIATRFVHCRNFLRLPASPNATPHGVVFAIANIIATRFVHYRNVLIEASSLAKRHTTRRAVV